MHDTSFTIPDTSAPNGCAIRISCSEIIVQRCSHTLSTYLETFNTTNSLRTLVDGVASIFWGTPRCFRTTLSSFTFLSLGLQPVYCPRGRGMVSLRNHLSVPPMVPIRYLHFGASWMVIFFPKRWFWIMWTLFNRASQSSDFRNLIW